MLQCGLCKENFPSSDDLKTHLEIHASELFDSDEEFQENEVKIEQNPDPDSDVESLIFEVDDPPLPPPDYTAGLQASSAVSTISEPSAVVPAPAFGATTTSTGFGGFGSATPALGTSTSQPSFEFSTGGGFNAPKTTTGLLSFNAPTTAPQVGGIAFGGGFGTSTSSTFTFRTRGISGFGQPQTSRPPLTEMKTASVSQSTKIILTSKKTIESPPITSQPTVPPRSITQSYAIIKQSDTQWHIVNTMDLQSTPNNVPPRPQPTTVSITAVKPQPQPQAGQTTITQQAGAGQRQPNYAPEFIPLSTNKKLNVQKKNILLRSGHTVYKLSGGNQLLSNIDGSDTKYLITAGGAKLQPQIPVPVVPATNFEQRALLPVTIRLQTTPPQHPQAQTVQTTITQPGQRQQKYAHVFIPLSSSSPMNNKLNLISDQKNIFLRSGQKIYKLSSGNQLLTTTGGAKPQQQIPAPVVPATSFQQRAYLPVTIRVQTTTPQQPQLHTGQTTMIQQAGSDQRQPKYENRGFIGIRYKKRDSSPINGKF